MLGVLAVYRTSTGATAVHRVQGGPRKSERGDNHPPFHTAPLACYLPAPGTLPLDGWTLRSHENSEHLKTTIVLARAAVCDIWFATPQPNSRTVRTPSTWR